MEEYRRFNDHIEVSNLGNVKRDGIVIDQSKDEYYYCVSIDGKPIRVHTMVGRCFPEICGEWHKHYHYHHINRNQLDNRAENIICLSPGEHKRMHLVEEGVSVGVRAYDKNGDYVGEWESKLQAAEATGVSYRHITNIILGKERRFTAGGYYWFKNDISDDEAHKRINEIKQEKYSSMRTKSKHIETENI